MRIEILQYDIVWEDREANFALLRQMISQSPPEPGSLLVLPEMFSTGFSMQIEQVGEDDQGPSARFLRQLAQEFQVAVVASFPRQPREPGAKGRNRLLAFGPAGQPLACYDKIHPFTYGQEAEHYEGGDRLALFDFGGWRICPTICYDLRFPELYRRAVLEGGAELLLVIANWPQRRREHWKALLRARAIENQAVVVGVNRVGLDPLVEYLGDSLVVDAQGQDLLPPQQEAGRYAVTLDRGALRQWREQFPALRDATMDFRLGEGPKGVPNQAAPTA